ncbi:unnamed protein product [Amaranthus hypochondriacus]
MQWRSQDVTQFTTMARDHASYASKVFNPCSRSQAMPNQWSPPEVSWIKINVDSHVATKANRGLGAVARDSNGSFLVAGVKRVKVLWPPDISEMAGAVYGLALAISLGYSHVHLEGVDNVSVWANIKNRQPGFSPFFLLLDRIDQLVSTLSGFKCSFIRRCGNTAAHLVARWNSGSFGETIYMYHFPQSLVTLNSLDIN